MFFGKHSQASIEKIRTSMTGRKHTKETKIKISERLSAKQNKDQNSYRAFLGHVLFIYKAIAKYAKDWNIPVVSQREFKNWSVLDDTYEKLYNEWKELDWNRYKSPVIIRKVKIKGFVVDNIYWSVKELHSWWSGELEYLKDLGKTMEARQIKNNKATEEETQERIAALKAKRKT